MAKKKRTFVRVSFWEARKLFDALRSYVPEEPYLWIWVLACLLAALGIVLLWMGGPK